MTTTTLHHAGYRLLPDKTWAKTLVFVDHLHGTERIVARETLIRDSEGRLLWSRKIKPNSPLDRRKTV